MIAGSFVLLTARSGRAMGDDEEVLVYKPYWAHLNQIGAPVRLTDADGAVVWAAEYEPFGKTVSLDEDPDGDGETVTMNFRFPGQYYDAETGLHYNWHRYYDPTAGRYLQAEHGYLFSYIVMSDLLRSLFEHYLYSENNPLTFTDRNGKRTILFVWQPTGHGVSSFGHVSVDINGTTYSYSDKGMNILDTDHYISTDNNFRDAVGMELDIDDQQEKQIQCYLDNYTNRRYNPITNNCTHPIQNALASIGFGLDRTIFPTKLMKILMDNGRVAYYHFYYSTVNKEEEWDDWAFPAYPWGK